MPPTLSAQDVRDILDEIGRRRRELNEQEETLRDATRAALRQSQGIIPRAEAARRVGLNRSTVYELYLEDED